jgi:hypothetical protein
VSAIVVSETVRVPESAITVRATRASGPGGQHVNKVATSIFGSSWDGVGSHHQERLPNPDRSERPRQPASPGSRDASP